MNNLFCNNNRQLVLASGNAGKLRELAFLLAPLNIQVTLQSELGISSAAEPFPTFVENALAKARHAAHVSGLPALADDSGLSVPALGGAPGVHSARYAGENADDAANNAQLIEALRGISDRRAAYICVLVLVRYANDPLPLIVQAQWSGEIAEIPRGENGFGYDPYFWLPALACTAAELSAQEKNKISHRGQAMRILHQQLAEWL